jgi:hypothetical protein
MGFDNIQKVFGECPVSISVPTEANDACETHLYRYPRYGISLIQKARDCNPLRAIGKEWRIFWMNDQPSHLTPEHLHGGIGP